MRFIFEFKLKNNFIQTDYRPAFLSFIKNALTIYENGIYFDDFYKVAQTKDFCFAVNLPKAVFEGDKIVLGEPEIHLLLSSGDARTALILYNSIYMQKGRAYPLAYDNEMTLVSARLENQKIINQPTISAKLLMPLCVRYHKREKNCDAYYAFDRDGFQETLREVIRHQISTSGFLSESVMDGFSFSPISMKRTVVKFYGQKIETSLGVFQMSGDVQLLNFLYENGFGSRRSSGFGCFEVITQGKEE